VFETRSAFFSEAPFTPGTTQLDSAWRIVSRRLVGAPARRTSYRVLPERGTSAQAFPTS